LITESADADVPPESPTIDRVARKRARPAGDEPIATPPGALPEQPVISTDRTARPRVRARHTGDAWPATRLQPLEWAQSDPFIPGVFAVSNMNRIRDRRGRIRDARTASSGYRMISFDGKAWLLHRVVYLMFYGQRPENQIDHVDGDPGNNDPINLEDVSASENMRRSHANPDRGSCSDKSSRAIVGSPDGWITTHEFPSITAAALTLGLHDSSVGACCHGKLNKTGGWVFAHQDQPDLKGEEWREITGTWVSNLERVQTETSGRYTPTPEANGYCRVRVKGRSFLFHRLVCQAFHGDPPVGYEADHIDSRKPLSNRADNLRWVSKQVNIAKADHPPTNANRVPVAVTSATENVEYESVESAARAEGVVHKVIARWCRSGKAQNGRLFAYVENAPRAGEIFKNVTGQDLLELGRKPSYPHTSMK